MSQKRYRNRSSCSESGLDGRQCGVVWCGSSGVMLWFRPNYLLLIRRDGSVKTRPNGQIIIILCTRALAEIRLSARDSSSHVQAPFTGTESSCHWFASSINLLGSSFRPRHPKESRNGSRGDGGRCGSCWKTSETLVYLFVGQKKKKQWKWTFLESTSTI